MQQGQAFDILFKMWCWQNCASWGKLLSRSLLESWDVDGGGLYNFFLPQSSMAPITGDLGPLGGVVVIACFRSASVGKWTRPLLNPPALLSACFLTAAKYTGPFVPHGPKIRWRWHQTCSFQVPPDGFFGHWRSSRLAMGFIFLNGVR